MKATKRFGLRKRMDSDKFKEAVNKVAALALLPNQFIDEGFESISKLFKNSKRWDRFKNYWLRQWKKANISVYSLKLRTNNFSESLNRTINLLIGRKRPNIWKLIHNLKTTEMLKSDELEQVVGGLMTKSRPKKDIDRLNEKIQNATKLFDETGDVEAFLENITFNDEIASTLNMRDDDLNDDDDDDDEIIPNHYDEESDFRKAHQREAAVKRKGSKCSDTNKKRRK